MSYQIKSTPFFRRMLSTSKKNGQLQKLKEEYDRIREFNERAIEMKMRQVRLKRLFREIEEIKESSSNISKRRRVNADRKTEEERRVETFVKAKELGKEYSRLNALILERRLEPSSSTPTVLVPTPAVTAKTKERIAKRINYGNETSRLNLQKLNRLSEYTIKRRPQKRERSRDTLFANSNDKKLKLKQRLDYGNRRSNINISKIPKRHVKHQIATEKVSSSTLQQQQPAKEMGFSETSYDELLNNFRVHNREPRVFRTFEQLPSSQLPLSRSSLEQSLTARAKKSWRKLALIVRHRFDNVRSRHQGSFYPTPTAPAAGEQTVQKTAHQPAQKPAEQTAKQAAPQKEFQLRSIPNVMHLPMNTLSAQLEPTQPASNVGEQDEMFLNFQSLETSQATLQPTPQQSAVSGLLFGDEIQLPQQIVVQQVNKFVKIFEPYVRQVAEKEAFEAFGVKKLRSMFEQQNHFE